MYVRVFNVAGLRGFSFADFWPGENAEVELTRRIVDDGSVSVWSSYKNRQHVDDSTNRRVVCIFLNLATCRLTGLDTSNRMMTQVWSRETDCLCWMTNPDNIGSMLIMTTS